MSGISSQSSSVQESPIKGSFVQETSAQSSGAKPSKAEGSTVSDLELVEQAKAELPYRTQAYERLMNRYQKLILSICYKMLGNRHDAEDVCQDVMLKVFNSLAGFEGRSSFKTWLSRIATNTCITSYDRIKRSNNFKQFMADDPTVTKVTKISSVKRDVEKAMSLLDIKDRQLLTLRYVSDIKIEEIADISGLSLSAAKMRLYRAQEALQKLVSS